MQFSWRPGIPSIAPECQRSDNTDNTNLANPYSTVVASSVSLVKALQAKAGTARCCHPA